MKTLFKTKIGSHLWGMETSCSDIDIFEVYIVPKEDILIGKADLKSRHIQEGNLDIVQHEIGKLVDQIVLNNFNYLIGVLSPLVIQDWGELPILRELTIKNISKLCYNSIHGLATHNYDEYIQSGLDNSLKRRQTIIRTLIFGIKLLSGSKPEFSPAKGDYSKEDILYCLQILDDAYRNSSLPEKPLADKEIYRWLLNVRLKS